MRGGTHSLSESMENYLEAILVLSRGGDGARSKDIASRLNVKRASVAGAVQALHRRGLVEHEPYGHVSLTPEGVRTAARVRRRHEALRDFFVQVLDIEPMEADEAACRMEHGISKIIVDRLIDFANTVAPRPPPARESAAP